MSQFERQWRDYLTLVRVGDRSTDHGHGREMTPEEVAALSDEQKVQLVRYPPSPPISRPDRRSRVSRRLRRCAVRPGAHDHALLLPTP